MAPRSALVRYGVAAAIAVAALVVRWLLPASLGPMLALFCIAILVAALAGTGPGLLATGLLAGALPLALAPGARLSLSEPDDQARLALLVLFGLLASLLAGRTAATLQRATQRLLLQAEVLRHLGEAVVAIDDRQRVVVWGAGAERLYGVAEAEALGLLGMAERARVLGGAVTFDRGAAGGTVVTARFPVPAPPAVGRGPAAAP